MTHKKQIIIVTDELDPHADRLILVLRAMGEEPLRIHPADFPAHSSLSLLLSQNHWSGSIQTQTHTIELEDIRSIWWRKPAAYQIPEDLSPDEQNFVRKELDHTLQGLWNSLDCYWMSHPTAIRFASSKPYQLQLATRLGLAVPRTLITMDPEQVRDFYEQCHGNIVYKVLSNPQVAAKAQRAVYTTPITAAQLDVIETVRATPCQFQEYIPKKLELRVTIIGDDIFTAEIHSQEHERTKFDWRHYDVTIPVKRGQLPDRIAQQCFSLTKHYGLNFGTIDLIVTPEDQYVFLEINPNGQWMWVQERIPELHMKEAMASYLMKGTQETLNLPFQGASLV
jgi:glutathione synthase/RimK-type ligase-like ATP-grasp enzyme